MIRCLETTWFCPTEHRLTRKLHANAFLWPGLKRTTALHNGLKLYEIDAFISWTKTSFPHAREWVTTVEQKKQMSEWMSDWPSGRVLMSGFLVVQDKLFVQIIKPKQPHFCWASDVSGAFSLLCATDAQDTGIGVANLLPSSTGPWSKGLEYYWPHLSTPTL